MDVKAVLFDMDGVLADSSKAWYHTFNDVCASQAVKGVSWERYRDDLSGQSLNDDLENWFTRLSLKELSELYEKKFQNHIGKTRVFPDARKVLEKLSSTGVKTAVVTNSPRPTTRQILENLGLTGFFDEILTGEDVAEGKPSPEIVLKALELLEVPPGKAIMVGDTLNDVLAARSAGVTVVGVGVPGDFMIGGVGGLIKLLDDL